MATKVTILLRNLEDAGKCRNCRLRAHAVQLFTLYKELYPCDTPPDQTITVSPVKYEVEIPSMLSKATHVTLTASTRGWVMRLRGWLDEAIAYVTHEYLADTYSTLEPWELLYPLKDKFGSEMPQMLAWVLCQALRRFPAEHPRVLEIIGNYAFSLNEYGVEEMGTQHTTSSISWYLWLYAARHRILGSSHPATAGALLGLGFSTHNCALSMSLLIAACKMRIARLGYEDFLTKNAINRFAGEANYCVSPDDEDILEVLDEDMGDALRFLTEVIDKMGIAEVGKLIDEIYEPELRSYHRVKENLASGLVIHLLREGRHSQAIEFLPYIRCEWASVLPILDSLQDWLQWEELRQTESLPEVKAIAHRLAVMWENGISCSISERDECDTILCAERVMAQELALASFYTVSGNIPAADVPMLRSLAQEGHLFGAPWALLSSLSCCPLEGESQDTLYLWNSANILYSWGNSFRDITSDLYLSWNSSSHRWIATFSWKRISSQDHQDLRLATGVMYHSGICVGRKDDTRLASFLTLAGVE